jgi:anti-anti-sigma factor
MNRRILVIDDQRSIHDDFRRILDSNKTNAKLGAMEAEIFGDPDTAQGSVSFEIDSAYQGEEGLDRVRKAQAARQPYAVVFVDVRMPPGWDGIETLARIFEEEPHTQAVLCTAYSDYEWANIAERIRQTDRYIILKKPFEPIEIRQIATALTARWWEDHALRVANQQLALFYSTTRILTHPYSIAEQGTELLEAIAATFNWTVGALWAVSEKDDRLRCVTMYGEGAAELLGEGAASSQTAGDRGLPARARSERAPCEVHQPTLEDDERAARALQLGLHTARAFPVFVGGRVELVLEFWSAASATLTDDTMALMTEVCTKIGSFIERSRLEVDLQRSRALSSLTTPLIPLSAHVVVMPLIGEIDVQRSERMRETLLQGVAERNVRTAILDITGVPSLDERTAEELVRTARAVRLLGARMVLTGLRPEAAQQIVAIGADLEGIVTLHALEDGIAFAMKSSSKPRRKRRKKL